MIAHHHAAAGSGGLFLTFKDRRRAVAPVSTHRHFFSFCGAMAAMFTGLACAVKPSLFSSQRHSARRSRLPYDFCPAGAVSRPSQFSRVTFHLSALVSPLWCGSSIWPTNSAPVFCLTRREPTLEIALQTWKLSRPSAPNAKSFTAAIASVINPLLQYGSASQKPRLPFALSVRGRKLMLPIASP